MHRHAIAHQFVHVAVSKVQGKALPAWKNG
jgi:hypothetical protein